MAQQLGALPGLAENWVLVYRMQIAAHKYLSVTPIPEVTKPSSDIFGHQVHTRNTCMHSRKTDMHTTCKVNKSFEINNKEQGRHALLLKHFVESRPNTHKATFHPSSKDANSGTCL